MAILTKAGRVAIAESLKLRDLHLAWGTGDGAWIAPPAESSTATGLMAEIGRRKATEVAFVTPAPSGEIVLPAGNFTVSLTPTNYLYARFAFDFPEASSSVIREVGMFVGTVVQSGLPAGQEYFTPGQITNPGRLVHLENLGPIYRSPAVRESFPVILAF